MLPTAQSGRQFLAGAALIALTAAAGFSVRGKAAPYVPDAPAYRQKGPKDAPIVIAEYSDFQCPACKAAVEPLHTIQKLFPGKIRVIFKHFPWDFHPWAKDAAIAAECAGKEDAFWAFHDLLYNKQWIWAQEKEHKEIVNIFSSFAMGAGLNEEKFRKCLKDPAIAQSVEAEFSEAKNNFVGSTPTFLINGKRFVGALQLRTLGLNHIENELKK
jgi:protein-disulfide isomerase